MELFTLDVNIQKPCVIALGYFDGVHIGHRAVITAAVDEAKKRGCASAVFTFTDSNKSCLKKSGIGEIYSSSRRCELVSQLGVDYVIMPDFSEFCLLSASQFVSLLCEKFCAQVFICGEDYRFGKNAAGDVNELKKLCKKMGVELFVSPRVMLDGEPVSSTRIREALKNGDVQLAERLLGREYSLKSEVVSGKHIGSSRLYPTVNQKFEKWGLIPKNGVYASKVLYDDKIYAAVTNIGVCPTVNSGQNTPNAETHILDRNLQLYGKKIEVVLKRFLREEKKFDSIEKLKAQISIDIIEAKKVL